MHRLIATGAATLAIGLTGQPAGAADLENGRKLAAEVCASCHDVSAGGPFKQYPPSFASIAVYRSTDQIRGRIISPPMHSGMPQLSIIWRPGYVDDVVAYIVSLEKSRP